jgi:hypothetical protein
MKQKLGEMTPLGFGAYRDRKDRVIIREKKTNMGYIVDKKLEKQYGYLQNRFLISGIVLTLVGYYFSWTAAVLLAGGMLAVLEFYYRRFFLTKLTVINGIRFPADLTFYDRFMEKELKTDLILAFGLLILVAFSFLNLFLSDDGFHFNVQLNNLNGILMLLFTIAICVLGLYVFWQCVRAIVTKIKEKKNA